MKYITKTEEAIIKAAYEWQKDYCTQIESENSCACRLRLSIAVENDKNKSN